MQYNPIYYIENLSPTYLPSSRGSDSDSHHVNCARSNAARGLEVTRDGGSTDHNEQTTESLTSSSIYELPPPDVNEEDMRINGEVLQNAQDWADFLDGTCKCDFERESDYTSGIKHHYHGRHDIERLGIHGWFSKKGDSSARDGADGEEDDNGGVRAWLRNLGAAFFIGLIPVIGFLVCFLLSYFKIFRPLSQLNIQASQREDLKKSMLKCVMADLVIGMMYPATPFLRLYFCSNRRMTFQARYRVVDHADRCTQAINQANAERSVASSIRAHTLTRGADSSSSVVSSTRPQQRKPRFVSRSNPYATIRPGTGQAIRLADITKREQLRRKKSTLSAPARLEGELCPRKKSKVVNPMGSWIQRMGSIWRHNAIKTVAGTDQLRGNGKIEGDLGAGVGTGSNVMVSALEPHSRRQREPGALDPIGKEPTATTVLLSSKGRKASEGGCYGTGGMTTSQAVIDNKNLVKVSQPTIVKQQQATRDLRRRGSVARGGTRKQWHTKQLQQQQRQHHNETSIVQSQVPQDNLQNLTTEILPVTEPKQGRLVSNGKVHFGSDMKTHRQAQRQDNYGQNCSSKCNGNHSRNNDSHQDCGRGCCGHKVEKSQPTGILQYSTVSAADASASSSNGNIAPPVEVSFVVSLAGPRNRKDNKTPSSKTVSMEPDACPIDGKQIKKEDDMEPQAQQDEVVIVIEESDNMLIGNRTQELPIQIQLPPPPTMPLPSLPQIEPAVSLRLETLTSDTEQLEISGLDMSSSVVDGEGVLMQYFYHVNSQETVVLTRQDPLYLEI